jgi:transcriptional regulator with XRE-family HTH domain
VTDDGNNELGRFLRARREQVLPESVGLPHGRRRRVPGLRRDELAVLCGISPDYYVRLEQGRDQNPSGQVLEAIAKVLGLDGLQTAHLYYLARPFPRLRLDAEPGVPSLVQDLIDSWPMTPALVVGYLFTVLAANKLGQSLSPAYAPGTNLLRAFFLDPAVKAVHPQWEAETEALVAALRPAVGGDTGDPGAARLVTELSERSGRFRCLWERHDIQIRASGASVFNHPRAGLLELRYQKMALLTTAALFPQTATRHLLTFQAEPGSASAHRLAALAEALPAEAGASADVLSGSR